MSELDSSPPLAVCASHELVEGGPGVRFELPKPEGDSVAAFAVRYEGVARAFLNQCAHIPVELDWQPGNFFDSERQFLICATHGATYRPHDGFCIAGPCRGKSLIAIPCLERDGRVWVQRMPIGTDTR
jgi:nitrite reductase/ring-hydroxylating ferredoxin subunit